LGLAVRALVAAPVLVQASARLQSPFKGAAVVQLAARFSEQALVEHPPVRAVALGFFR